MERYQYRKLEQFYGREHASHLNEQLCKGYLQELLPYPNFLVWRYTPDRKKLPINPRTGTPANPTNPDTWGTANDVLKRIALGYENGIGFALNGTPYTIIDIDHAVGMNRTVYYPGKDAIELFNSYTEHSPTDGLHIWVEGESPTAIKTKWLEMYSRDRYITLTLNHLPGTPVAIEKRQEIVEWVYSRFRFSAAPPMAQGVAGEPSEGKRYSDIQVIERALRNDKTGEFFGQLLKGDPALYTGAGALFPSKSEADFALVRQLAFWTYQDPEQMDRLFRQSGLYSDKWDERRGQSTYGEITVRKALQQRGK